MIRQVTVVDSTPGLVVNKKRVEGVITLAVSQKHIICNHLLARKIPKLKKLKLLLGDAHCEPLGKQGAFSVG